eukprot:GHUV01022833.1.p2 GENE.GHUV01022833.1~~GHUV01022833.1.p2  ORF type:complete len:131 (-),score=2.33 GHUV01022833.1:592-984(-)
MLAHRASTYRYCCGATPCAVTVKQAPAPRKGLSPAGSSPRKVVVRVRAMAEFAATAGKPIECKAAIAWDAKKKLEVTNDTVSPPGPGEVRVKIVATALCHTVSSTLPTRLSAAAGLDLLHPFYAACICAI